VIVRLRVAGLTLRASSKRPMPGLRLPARLRSFASRRGADIDLEVREAEPPTPPPGARLFDSGGLWSVHRLGPGQRLYVVREPVSGRPPLRALSVDDRLRRGILYVPRAPQSRKVGYALGFPLDEVLFQHRLAAEGGAFVHSCAVRIGRGAALFCGVSGAGKTTIARLFHRAGYTVLSDDRVALVPDGRGVRAFGTPWHGSGRFGSPRSAPLRAVFFLTQAGTSEVAPFRSAGARLFSLTFPPLWDGAGVGRVLAACDTVATRVPTFELRFRKDRTAVAAVEDALRKRPVPAPAGALHPDHR
jgi:hypothetical protein